MNEILYNLCSLQFTEVYYVTGDTLEAFTSCGLYLSNIYSATLTYFHQLCVQIHDHYHFPSGNVIARAHSYP